MEKSLTWEKRLNDGDIIRKMNPSRSRIKKFETVAIVEIASPDIEARHAPGMELVRVAGTNVHERNAPPDTKEFGIGGQTGQRSIRHKLLAPDVL